MNELLTALKYVGLGFGWLILFVLVAVVLGAFISLFTVGGLGDEEDYL